MQRPAARPLNHGGNKLGTRLEAREPSLHEQPEPAGAVPGVLKRGPPGCHDKVVDSAPGAGEALGADIVDHHPGSCNEARPDAQHGVAYGLIKVCVNEGEGDLGGKCLLRHISEDAFVDRRQGKSMRRKIVQQPIHGRCIAARHGDAIALLNAVNGDTLAGVVDGKLTRALIAELQLLRDEGRGHARVAAQLDDVPWRLRVQHCLQVAEKRAHLVLGHHVRAVAVV
mmetsp:Transcript_68339/g.193636  ORF Transcript_68339/g.193636 Transcript_68339/m.193636 type:complete len:226 (-) Transcript_68339:160-837(-)